MTNLQKLIARCKAGISIDINTHKDYYETVEERLKHFKDIDILDDDELDPPIRQQMIKCDTIVDLQFYPDTPIGSYRILHYDVEEAIKKALEVLGVK